MKTRESYVLKMFMHVIRYDSYLRSIVEWKIEGKSGRERPKRSYLYQVRGKIYVMSYQEIKDRSLNRDDWRSLHQEEPSF